MPKRLGEQLLRAGLINEDQLRRAAQEQKISGGLIGSNLIRLGFLKEQQLLDFLASHYGFPAVDLTTIEIEPETLALVPRDVCTKHQVIPISRAGSTLVIAMADPLNMFAIDDVKFLTGYNIDVVVAGEDAIRTALEGHFGDPTEREMASLEDVMSGIEAEDFEVVDTDEDVDIAALERETSEAPVVKLVNVILTEAIRRGASDIHIEPYEKSFRVRYRLDGVLHKIMDPPLKLRNGIISRLKIMSELDIAERRLPQDGRIKLKMGRGREMDFRVSVIPTLFGEKTVLRLLDKSNLQLDMTKLGFDPEPLTHFQDAIHQPYGMVLVTGPTGSGKTTTLYSALSELNKEGENISTAEDPVEFNLAGINQVQMHESIGLNFASALRSFLRQDPDIIMVGEIRDFETAEIAVKAALTGHLVLSTLHTNDAPGTINRLLNMGVEPFLIASSVHLILAQRLARKICEHCKEHDEEVTPEALRTIGLTDEEANTCRPFRGRRCAECNETGFRGRIALYEVMPVREEIRDLILAGASHAEIKDCAIRLGMCTLRRSGIKKLIEGITTVSEICRVTAADSRPDRRE